MCGGARRAGGAGSGRGQSAQCPDRFDRFLFYCSSLWLSVRGSLSPTKYDPSPSSPRPISSCAPQSAHSLTLTALCTPSRDTTRATEVRTILDRPPWRPRARRDLASPLTGERDRATVSDARRLGATRAHAPGYTESDASETYIDKPVGAVQRLPALAPPAHTHTRRARRDKVRVRLRGAAHEYRISCQHERL